ncbi:MAG: hypothetical protein HYR94_05730 [Chloroflexi bacterium]|nr:hypothetical protein [Chloroflexota bacterium]
MSKINEVNSTAIAALQGKITNEIKVCNCLEQAAQKLTDVMYAEFQDSFVLVRLYATVPFNELPAANQAFVTKLAAAQNITSLIKDQTLVLSLLGTRGVNPAWNSRYNSKGHVGIPLASADFIEAIPMISRLLKELGLSLDWIGSQDTEIVTRSMGKIAGLFYVPDAKTAVDQKGRKIIAAQDFVAANNVKTVFGFGGGYFVGATIVVVIAFALETIEKSKAERFMPLVNVFKTGTTSLVSNRKIFA